MVLIGTLSQVLPVTAATAVAVASRAVCLLTDLGISGVCALIMVSRRWRPEESITDGATEPSRSGAR
jgi:hypothetical protein